MQRTDHANKKGIRVREMWKIMQEWSLRSLSSPWPAHAPCSTVLVSPNRAGYSAWASPVRTAVPPCAAQQGLRILTSANGSVLGMLPFASR